MNIKQAKQQISDTLRAYLTRDELGNYLIPSVRQRPVLLMGPPGIGKTQIMEQIASEQNVGLVAYTITHHTRQSAIGLPFIEKRVYGGQEFSVTEYTMSEIIGSVYQLMERTGLREGILFLDEINCVSETLAPMMLQFLQCKTFGNQRLPEGWLIVAAGNPPEYNRSVRDFDVVTLDRVRRLDVDADFAVWKEYALRRGLHGAVLSYLDIKKENFYRIEATADGQQIVTARGWEDLSELLFAYEKLSLPVDVSVVLPYIQYPAIARDFANYLSLYRKYQESYHVDEILRGTWAAATESEFAAAPFDEKLSVLSLLLSRLSFACRSVRLQDALTVALHASLLEFRDRAADAETLSMLESLSADRRTALRRAADAGQGDREQRSLLQREINALDAYAASLRLDPVSCTAEAMERLKPLFAEEVEKRASLSEEASSMLDAAFRFLESSVGPGQELVLFVTELTAGYDTSWFIEAFGCDAYFRHNRELLFDDTRSRILQKLAAPTL